MRIANGIFLGSGGSGGPNPLAAYAFAFRPTTGDYWKAGVQYSPVTALPGYTFTRSGQQGAVDASGAVQFFAANAPAINTAGYAAYVAATNSVFQSQNFTTADWIRTNVTVTVNAATAPDGTSTANLFVPSVSSTSKSVSQNPGVAGQRLSVFVKAAGYTKVALKESGTTGVYASFDLSGGGSIIAFTSAQPILTTLANGWFRITMPLAASTTAGLQINVLAPAYVSGDPNSGFFAGDGTSGVYVWQAQILAGTFVDGGGPLIATTTAAASIGASALAASVANGVYNATYTFDDNSTQVVATTIAAGVFTFPTPGTLNRNIIKQVIVN